ncbi:hypothetical protein EV215_0291 [Hypnocyclicus thermotrophus]|uniref:Outer membrane protein with beta-barrel domain n=1 Tax=Hypnocyclicus thermotrophus TaxID=1627895 RepID=A0AA46E0D5_9FUSO|nr:hypothetical protein [Hypnocyclicus thermotrophus]TDT72485.1 hypothetical protein EV215_0291 [Hypnocyclicus thermotrophus]
MKKYFLILVLLCATITNAHTIELEGGIGIINSISTGITGIIPLNQYSKDILINYSSGMTPLIGEYYGVSIKLQEPNGFRYGIFYKERTIYDGLWEDIFSNIFSGGSSNSNAPDSKYDIYGIGLDKVFSSDEFFSPWAGIDIGYSYLRNKDSWSGENGYKDSFYMDFKLGIMIRF